MSLVQNLKVNLIDPDSEVNVRRRDITERFNQGCS